MRALPQSRLLVLPLVVISCVILHTITHSDPAALHTTNSLDGVLSSHQRTRGQRALLQDETTEGGGDTSGAGNHESGIKEPREGPGHQGPLRRGGRGGAMEGGPEAGPRGNPGGGTRGVPGGDPGVGPRGVPGGERGRNPFFPRKGGLGFSRDGMGPPGSFRNPGKAGPGWGKQGAAFDKMGGYQGGKRGARAGAREKNVRQRLGDALANKNVSITGLRIPIVYLIAAPKTGSTAFAEMLYQHPKLCRPQTKQAGELGRKETHFFSKPKLRSKGLKHLSSLFEHDPKCKSGDVTEFIFVDATPDYMYGSGKAMKQILPSTLHPKLKFIAVFREPIARDVSWFNHARFNKKPGDYRFHSYDEWAQMQLEIFKARNPDQRGGARRELAAAPRNMRGKGAGMGMKGSLFWGLYAKNLDRWWRTWGKGQTLVLSYDTILANTSDTMQRVARFLGVDGSVWSEAALPTANQRAYASKIYLKDATWETCEQLKQFYAPHNRKLYQMLAENVNSTPAEQPPFPPFKDPCLGLQTAAQKKAGGGAPLGVEKGGEEGGEAALRKGGGGEVQGEGGKEEEKGGKEEEGGKEEGGEKEDEEEGGGREESEWESGGGAGAAPS